MDKTKPANWTISIAGHAQERRIFGTFDFSMDADLADFSSALAAAKSAPTIARPVSPSEEKKAI